MLVLVVLPLVAWTFETYLLIITSLDVSAHHCHTRILPFWWNDYGKYSVWEFCCFRRTWWILPHTKSVAAMISYSRKMEFETRWYWRGGHLSGENGSSCSARAMQKDTGYYLFWMRQRQYRSWKWWSSYSVWLALRLIEGRTLFTFIAPSFQRYRCESDCRS